MVKRISSGHFDGKMSSGHFGDKLLSGYLGDKMNDSVEVHGIVQILISFEESFIEVKGYAKFVYEYDMFEFYCFINEA